MSDMKLQLLIEAQNKASEQLNSVMKELNNIGKEIANTSSHMSSMEKGANSVAGAMKALVAVAASYASIKIAEQFISTAASFEKLNTQLKTILGSSAAAEQAMSWISNFTAKTPYELEDVSEAFKKLSAHGLNAVDWMKMLGDTASAMGKSLDQTVDMFTDAMTGEFERLKEYGVKAKTEGDKVTFAWSENGKSMTVEAQKNSESISAALGQIFERFRGGMDDMSKTWSGMMSNLSDNWTIFQKAVMDSGPFEALKANLQIVLEKIEELKKSGQFDEIARETGAVVVEVIAKIITAVGWLPTALFSVIEAVDKTTAYIVAMGQAAVNATAFIAASINPLKAYQVATEGFRATFPTLASANDSLESLGSGLYNSGEAASRSAQKFASFIPYVEGLADNIRNMANTTPKASQGTDLLTSSTEKAATAHKASAAETKKASDAANKYAMVIDELNGKLAAINGDDYSKKIAEIEKQFLSYAKTVGAAKDVLQKWYDTMKSQAGIDSMKEVLDIEALNTALKDLDDQYAQLSLTKLELMDYELSKWYEDERLELIKNNAVSQEAIDLIDKIYEKKKKLNDDLKNKEIWDGFSENGKTEISDIAEHWEKENKKAAEGVQKIWDKAWKNIESDFADTIYDMMDKGIDGFDDFFEKIGSMFKKLLAEMVAAWVVSGLKTLLSGGEGAFSLAGLFGGSKDSATGTATSALSLASLVKSIADLPSTIAAIPSTLMEGLTSIGEAIGLLSVPASTAAAATAQTSTAAAAVAMKKLAEASAGAAAAGGIGAAALGIGGMAAAILGIGAIMSGGFDKILAGPTWAIDTLNEIKKAEQGRSEYDKAMIDEWKASLLYQSVGGKQTTDSYGAITWADFDALDFAEKFQSLWDMPIAGLEAIWAEQNGVLTKYTALWESSDKTEESRWALWNKVFVDFGTEAAGNMGKTLTEKMYDLGFVASKTGWESAATISMITELKDSGIAWSDINSTLETYGVTDAEVYKRIYAEYHGDSILTDLASLTAALSAEGMSEDVLKTIKYIYESNIPLDQMQALLEWAGMSSEEAARIVGQIDPSDEWKDLVIPVDAPDSIPVAWEDPAGRASGGPVSAGTPYIIGEVGPELFVPQESGHILSNANMKKLMGMGVQGFADGTTDPLPGTQEWWDANPPSDSDINGNGSSSGSSDTSTYDSLSEWLDDYMAKLREWLGTGNDLSDQLFDLNEYYKEQYKYADELGASFEQIEKIQQDQQKAKEKILQEWLNNEIDYYNEAMGYNTALGDSLKEIGDHYDTAIEEATSAGATEEQLGEIRKAQTEVTTKAMKDWLAGEVDYYNGMMGLNTELGGTLDGISERYANAIAEATAAGATEEQLAEIRKAASEVTTKALQDWLEGETDYYNEMMGNTSALGSALDEINKHYENTIAEAKAAGATEEQLAEIRKAASEVSQKAIQDEYDSFVDYYNQMMGNTNELKDQIDEVKKKFDEYKKSLLAIDPNADLSGLDQALQNIIDKLSADYWDDYADKVGEFTGISNDWMNQVQDINDFFKKAYDAANGNADKQKQIMSDWMNSIQYLATSLMINYQSQVNEWMGITETGQEKLQREIDTYFLMVYYFLAAMKASPEVLQSIVDDYNAVTARNQAGLIGNNTGSTGTGTTSDDGFSSALSEFTSELESYVDELKSLVESITSKIDDIKYSSLNPYLTSSSKMAMAQGDYQKLFAAAKSGSTEDVQKYLDFVETYLQSAQNRYKSSTAYQQIYQQVMKDLGIIQSGTQTKLTKSEELLDKLNSNAVNSYSVLNDIKTILWNIQHGTQSSTAGSLAMDSYGSVAGITSSSRNNTNEDNKKIVELLEGIYMAQNKPQRVTITLDSGRTLTGEMKSVADGVYVERASRPNMSQRRIYQ